MRRRKRALLTAAATMTAIWAGTPTAGAVDFGGGPGYLTTGIAPLAPLDARSSQWIAGLGRPAPYVNGPGGQFAPPVYEATGATPLREVRCAYCGAYTGTGGTNYAGRITIPIPDAAVPDPSADGHIAIVDRGRGEEWDLIGASRNGDGSWNARGAGHFALGGDGHQDNLAGGGSATASHLPLSQAFSVDEIRTATDNGTYLIPHALSFGAPNVDGRCWVYPALGSDGGVAGGLPEGARLQLDPYFDASGLPPAARVIAQTLQVYGAYLRDLSGAFVLYARPTRDGDAPWSSVGVDGDALAGIPTARMRILSANFATLGTSQPFVQRPDLSCGPGADRVEPNRSADGRTPVTGGATSTAAAGSTSGTSSVASTSSASSVSGSGVGAGSPVPAKTAAGTPPAPKAPRLLRTKRADGRTQLVWNSTEAGRRYRVYVDGRLILVTTRTYTGMLKLKPGRRTAYVQAQTTAGTLGGRTATISFTM